MLTPTGPRGPGAAAAAPGPGTRTVLALALVLAASIHALVVAEHLDEWPLAGAFFLALELVEGSLAVAVVITWSRVLGWFVVATGLATLAVWAVSRAWGLPFGPPQARLREVVAPADLACCVLELTSVVVAGWCLRARGGRPWPLAARRVTLGALVALCLVVASWGLRAALDDPPHHAGETSVALAPGVLASGGLVSGGLASGGWVD